MSNYNALTALGFPKSWTVRRPFLDGLQRYMMSNVSELSNTDASCTQHPTDSSPRTQH